jgi:lysophospholipid acyltransferase (LPLAT)-like uncharacterized protein
MVEANHAFSRPDRFPAFCGIPEMVDVFHVPMSSKKGNEIRSDRKSAVLGMLAGWAMKLLGATLRFQVRDLAGVGAKDPAVPPVIMILWHNRFFSVPPAWQKLCGSHRKMVVLTSASHDGDMVARAMAVFGLGAIRGSSSRRGVAALVGLKRASQEGLDICLTPDGPRGPRYIMQPGVIKLAESTGAPIVPIHVLFSSAWRLKSWDRFVIPKPFSRVEVTFGPAIHLSRGMDPETFENERLKLELLLVKATDDA